MKKKIIALCLGTVLVLSAMSGCQNQTAEKELIGKVTKIEGSKVTIALGTQNDTADKKQNEDKKNEDENTATSTSISLLEGPPAMPDGMTPGAMNQDGETPPQGGGAPQGNPPAMPDGSSSGAIHESGDTPQGTPPSKAEGASQSPANIGGDKQPQNGNGQSTKNQQGDVPPGMPGAATDSGILATTDDALSLIILNGKEKTVVLSNDTKISGKDNEKSKKLSSSDLKEGDIVKITMSGDDVVSILILNDSE